MIRHVLITLLFFVQPSFSQKFTDLAQTPPMGWNSWNNFGCNVSEQMIKAMADAMVTSGLKDAGYQYIVIDDCWQVSRDADGTIIADAARFPSGIEALADYIHGLGLKFGLYSCAGTLTCAGRPGSKDYEYKDAETYAAWKVDYLKYDWCNTTGQNTRTSYKLMSDALQASGRPIVFSICEWGSTQPWLWAQGIGHLWRTTGDIQANWNSIMDILDRQVGLEKYAGPGGWNDPDMLEVGNGNLTLGENRAHFGLWCLLAAPLMAGNDLRSMNSEIIDILTNKEVIAVNQDSLGVQGYKIKDEGAYETWIKPMLDSSTAVILLNRSQIEKSMSVYWEDIGYAASDILLVRNLWEKQDAGYLQTFYSAVVPPHDVVMLRVWPKTPPSEIPTVSFTLPADSSRFSVTQEIRFNVTASDADGEIVHVDITANGEMIGTDTEQTDGWSLSWKANKPGVYQIFAYATDNTGISASSQPIWIYLEPDSGPFYGTPTSIPGILEAEDYDGGGEGYAYHDSEKANLGGLYRWDGVDIGFSTGNNSCYYVGWFESGEWLKYTIDVPETESYDISLNIAAATSTGRCSLELNGNTLTSPFQIPGTGAANVWETTILSDISMAAGVNELKLIVEEKDFKLNNFMIDYALVALPEPWAYRDIGQTAVKGDAGIRKKKFIVNASGSDIWNNSDEFGFVYQKFTGDGEISARVVSLDDTDPWSKAGIMMRNYLSATSNHAMTIVSAANGIAFQRRVENGSSSTHTAGSNVHAPYWVKLTRKGRIFTGYESSNGTTWQRVDAISISMNETIYAGLAVTAHYDGLICNAVFDNVEIQAENTKVNSHQTDTIDTYELYPLFPNPFNSSLSIKYNLNIDTRVKISIYDILGRKVRLLEDGQKKTGSYCTLWNAKDDNGGMVASGIYICTINFGEKSETKKVLFIK